MRGESLFGVRGITILKIACAAAATAAAAAVPLWVDPGTLFFATEMWIAVIFASSVSFVVGIGGVAAFGNQLYYSAAGYLVAFLALHYAMHNAVLLLAAGVAAGAVAAFLTGLVLIRGSGLAFGMITLALGAAAYSFVNQSPYVYGANGIAGVPRGRLIGLNLTDSNIMYWVVLFASGATILLLAYLRWSLFGRILAGSRESVKRSESIGVPVVRFQSAAFTMGGALSALAGGLHALHTQDVDPSIFFWSQGAFPVLEGLIGGIRTITGPVLGAIFYQTGQFVLGGLTQVWLLILGAAVVMVFIVAPDGLVPMLGRVARWVVSRAGVGRASGGASLGTQAARRFTTFRGWMR